MEATPQSTENRDSARFDLRAIARSFPETAQTLLLDTYLTNEPAASARVFKVYRDTPPHYHATCDESLRSVRHRLVLDGQRGGNGNFPARPFIVL
jgi:hypothetical protein